VLIDCARRGKQISDHLCCQIIIETVRRSDLEACLCCEYGKALAATCPLNTKPKKSTPEGAIVDCMEGYPGGRGRVNLLLYASRIRDNGAVVRSI